MPNEIKTTHCLSCETIFSGPIVYQAGSNCPVCRGIISEREVAEVSGSHASYFIDASGRVVRTETTCDCDHDDPSHAVPEIRYFRMHEWANWYGTNWQTATDFDILDLGGIFEDGTEFNPSPSHRRTK